MILLLSCVQNSWKWKHIQDNWLNPSNIPYVILVGNPNIPRSSYKYDASSNILQIGCEDNYDEIVHKIAYGISAVVKLFDPLYILKIDDDVIINVPLLHAFMQSNITLFDDVNINNHRYENNDNILYGGFVVNITKSRLCSFASDKYVFPKNKSPIKINPVVYCGGPIYYLKKPAINILSQVMDPDSMVYEDINVGNTLGNNGIHPVDLPLYTNDFVDFKQKKCIGWHDVNREHPQNIFVKKYKSQISLLQSRFSDIRR